MGLREKVAVYERFLHALQMHAEVTMDASAVKQLIENACNWSYAHRVGNGELSPKRQRQIIENAFKKLLNTSKDLRNENNRTGMD